MFTNSIYNARTDRKTETVIRRITTNDVNGIQKWVLRKIKYVVTTKRTSIFIKYANYVNIYHFQFILSLFLSYFGQIIISNILSR